MGTQQHVVVGAGPVGVALARELVDRGHRVRVVTRSGRPSPVPGVEVRALDASDADALTSAVRGAAVLYNCANPGSYPRWEHEWPPLARAVLAAAQRTDAVLATVSNLYGYGPVPGPITRQLPLRPSDPKGALRARMWQDVLDAHEAGRVRATEARASDYLGPSVPVSNGLLPRYARATLAGRTAWVLADPDQPHSWTAVEDVAVALATLASDERAWGSPWLVPSHPPTSVRHVLRELSDVVGRGEPRLRRVPAAVLRAGGRVVPLLREVDGIRYQFDEPFVVDTAETTATFGLEPVPWRSLVETTARAWAARRD